MEAKSKELNYNNRSLERALQILCSFNVERPSVSLIELSRLVDLPKPTVFRLCSTLTKYDFLQYDPGRKQFSLGLRLYQLGGVVFSSLSLRKLASPFLERLHTRTGKTVFIGTLRETDLIYLDKKEDPGNPIQFASNIGTRRPPYFGMLGQLLMAYLSEAEVAQLLRKHPLARFTKKSITDVKSFKKRLMKIREQGFFVDEEEAIEGITGIAAPVRDFSGSVVAAIGVGFISSSLEPAMADRIRNELLKTAKEISQELGREEETHSGNAQALK